MLIYLLKGDGVDILVEDEWQWYGEVEDVEAFGTQSVWQNFDGITDNKRGKCNAETILISGADSDNAIVTHS